VTIVQFDEPFATGSNRCSAYLFPPAAERTHRVESRRIIELRDNKTLGAAQAREMSPAAEVTGYKEGVITQQLANLKASGDYARIMREVERETVNGSYRGGLCRARVASHSDARCPRRLSPKPWLWRAGTPVPRRSRFVPTLEIPQRADAALLQTPSPVSLRKQHASEPFRGARQHLSGLLNAR
jgi:hypothetical protein